MKRTTLGVIETGTWPVTRSRVLDWLAHETSGQPFIDDILVEMCGKLREQGLSVARATLHVRTNHPQWLGATMIWRTGMIKAEMRRNDYESIERDAFLKSPIKVMLDGAAEIRAPLGRTTAVDDPYEIFEELRAQGLTDYVMWPIEFTRGQRHVVTFASDGPDGFTPGEIGTLRDLMPVFSLATEVRLRNRLARQYLQTYVGPHASEQILAGATRRGSGVTTSAVIIICDLRGFTAISELWPRDDVIAMLNAYFDAMSEPIERHGGEILKFMGDGLLAIFPLDRPDVFGEALRAVGEARLAMAELNDERVRDGLERLGYGVGVHVGDVMYGNIGSRSRLDFTVIGPAVNVASRLEALTKTVGRAVLLSGAFVAQAGDESAFDALGALALPGVAQPTEVFALAEPSL